MVRDCAQVSLDTAVRNAQFASVIAFRSIACVGGKEQGLGPTGCSR
jgi:hypothetical protein